MKKFLLSLLIVLICAAAGYYGYRFYEKQKGADNAVGQTAAGKRQAVFLSNGQVYFGYISDADKQIVKLQDIYYLKSDSQSENTDQNNGKANNVTLVKIGSELHGPEDIMYINRDQILYYENMRDDSEISKMIKGLQENKQ